MELCTTEYRQSLLNARDTGGILQERDEMT